MKRKNTLMAGLACLLLFLVTEASVLAAEEMTITEHVTAGQEIALYVEGVPDQWDEIAYQIGTVTATISGTQTVSKAEETLYTLILWDNSLSVMKKYGEDIRSILTDVVANRAPNEKFAIATIGKEVVFQTDYTDDYTVLKEQIGAVEGENKEAYIIENVYEAVLSLNAIPDCGYRRIILISDGMDATEIGYSRAELDTLLSQNACPIYTIGVLDKDRQEELQDMFALSRTTHADYFYVNETEDLMMIVRGFSADYSLLQVKVAVSADLQDGSTQNSQLTVMNGSETYTATSYVMLPFSSSDGGETMEEALEGISTSESPDIQKDAGEPEWETEPEEEGEILAGIPLKWILFAGAGVLVLLVLIVVVLVVSRKKKAPAAENDYARLDQQIKNERYGASQQPSQSASAMSGVAVSQQPEGSHKTQMMGQSVPAQPSGAQKTQFLFSGAGAEIPVHRLTMTNIQDAVKSYQCCLLNSVIVGRDPAGCGLVIDDSAVSGRHCEIGLSTNVFYIKDLGSSNGTFVNGCKINPQVMTEIQTGCTLRLGRVDYRITVE